MKLESVLIVDDDPILCVVTSAIFKSAGAEKVIVAEDGLKGLNIIDDAATAFDFILCDLGMPCMDGIEFLRNLGKRKFNGRIAILSGEHKRIVETAHELAISHNLNVVGTFNKPLNIKELKSVIETSCDQEPDAPPQTDFEFSYDEIKSALEHGEIVAHYQPKIDVASKAIVGAEALARWHHPKHGLVMPASFIPVIEGSGLIDQLTYVIFECAIKDAARWRKSEIFLNTSVNIAAASLNNLSLPNELRNRVDNVGLLPEDFTLEITETGVLQKTPESMEVIARLRIQGFGISIDDFGTGNSNIEQLVEYPFSELKIDQSFIQQATTDEFARTCVEMSIKLARKLNLQLVAEGVEDSNCWDFVAKSGIDIVQGFYIAKPMSSDVFSNWYLDHQRSRANHSLVGKKRLH